MKKWNLNIDMMCYIVLMLKSMLVVICSYIISTALYGSFEKYFIIFFIISSFIIFIFNVVLTNTEDFVSCRKFIPKMFYKNKFKKHQKHINGKFYIQEINLDNKTISVNSKKNINKLYKKLNKAKQISINGLLYLDKELYFETKYNISKKVLFEIIKPYINTEQDIRIKDITFEELNQDVYLNWITNPFFKDEYYIQIKDSNNQNTNINNFHTDLLCEIFGKLKIMKCDKDYPIFIKKFDEDYFDLNTCKNIYKSEEYKKLIQLCKDDPKNMNLNQQFQVGTIILH